MNTLKRNQPSGNQFRELLSIKENSLVLLQYAKISQISHMFTNGRYLKEMAESEGFRGHAVECRRSEEEILEGCSGRFAYSR